MLCQNIDASLFPEDMQAIESAFEYEDMNPNAARSDMSLFVSA